MTIDRRLPLAAAALLALAPARARAGGNPFDEGKALGAILSHGAPTDPVDPGEWRVKASPGLVRNGDDSGSLGRIDLRGGGASASATRGLGAHWGLALVAGGDALTGTTPVVDTSNPAIEQGARSLFGNAAFSTGDTTARGVLAAAGVVWDHWTGAGFRLPVIAGLSYLDMTETSENKAAGARTVGTLRSPGVYVGVIPQFNVWKVRVAPFATFSDAFLASRVKLTNFDPNTGATIQEMTFTDSENSDNRQTHTLGVAFGYVPWGVGFTYIPSLEGISAYTLTFSRRFGGPPKPGA